MYSLYTGISHYNQLSRLKPRVLRKIEEDVDDIASGYGGRVLGKGLYRFPSVSDETIRKIAEATFAIKKRLLEDGKDLYGTTILILGEGDETDTPENHLEYLLLQVPDEDGLWLDSAYGNTFDSHFDLVDEGSLFRITGLKEAGPRLENRLGELMVRSERERAIRKVLESMEREDADRTVLVLRGPSGLGKRATLYRALNDLYPDDGGSPVVMPVMVGTEDPLEPFARSVGSFVDRAGEFLDENERGWWETEAYPLLSVCRNGEEWTLSRDQGPVDLIQSYALYLKAHIEFRKRRGRPAYLIVDGLDLETETFKWLRTLVTQFSGKESFRLILIRDTGGHGEALPLPGRGKEVMFRFPGPKELASIVRRYLPEVEKDNDTFDTLTEISHGSMVTLFHTLLFLHRGEVPPDNPTEALISEMDEASRTTLFLAGTARGLATKAMLVGRFGGDEEAEAREGVRFEHLEALGLITPGLDGRIAETADVKSVVGTVDIGAAERFGEYLTNRFRERAALSPIRLFRFLEEWGPAGRGLEVLDGVMNHLLSNRRLRMAGALLNNRPMGNRDLASVEMEALQNVLGAARLRYILLAGDPDQALELIKDGTISLIGARGDFSEGFRLQIARYNYNLGRYDDSLVSAKEALFAFQKTGDHRGETHSHLELALSLLAGGKTRDALEHFGIARRIGYQVNDHRGLLRAGTLETAARFLFGNVPRALRDGREVREVARTAGRRDDWLLLTLLETRILFELGHFDEAADRSREGIETARFYSLVDEERVFNSWRGRALVFSGRPDEGNVLWKQYPEDPETSLFAAEAAWLAGRERESLDKLRGAPDRRGRTIGNPGEKDVWSDGFALIEGRLSDGDRPMDVLGERLRCFSLFVEAANGTGDAADKLGRSLESEGRRISRPFGYLYAFWHSQAVPEAHRELLMRSLSLAFNALQARAGRFDDNQSKHAWLSVNPWNKRIMDEAQRRKFL